MIEAQGLQHSNHLYTGRCQAAKGATGRNRTNKHVGVRKMRLQPDPVTQQRASVKWGTGINSQNGYAHAFFDQLGDHSADQCALSTARRTGNARNQGSMGRLKTTQQIQTARRVVLHQGRSEEHTSELQSLMRISYAVFCLKKKKKQHTKP